MRRWYRSPRRSGSPPARSATSGGILDNGELFAGFERQVVGFIEDDGRMWRAVLKVTGDGAETYLVSLHKAQPTPVTDRYVCFRRRGAAYFPRVAPPESPPNIRFRPRFTALARPESQRLLAAGSLPHQGLLTERRSR